MLDLTKREQRHSMSDTFEYKKLIVSYHGDMTHQHGVAWVDLERFAVVDVGKAVPLLLEVDKTDAVECVVQLGFDTDGRLERGEGLLQLLNGHKLVAEESVGVGKSRIDLGEQSALNYKLIKNGYRSYPVKVDNRRRADKPASPVLP